MADPSFYHAIFKRLSGAAGSVIAHVTDETIYGGFSLKSTGAPNGLFGALGPGPYAGLKPLKAGDFTPENNPLYAILNASLGPEPLPAQITVNNQSWPVMPYPSDNGSIQNYTMWLDFNDAAKPPRLIDAIHDWIALQHKPDDTPKGQQLGVSALSVPPAAFPLKPKEDALIIFVASMPKDDGRRPGDGDINDPGPNYVPAHYWDTALIFVTDTLGNDEGLPVFTSGAEHYIAAVIGNSGNGYAGRALISDTPMTVICNAYAFMTAFGPGVPLPSLHNLDPKNLNPVYEQYFLPPESYDVAGFRFLASDVYKALAAAMQGWTLAQLGGFTVDQWLKKSHACVKVLITGGEIPSPYTGAWPTETSLPTKDRHIAQRNLAKFDMSLKAAKNKKKMKWQYFIMSQAGPGLNALALSHGLPVGACTFYLAVPTQAFERYIADGGSTRGFARVHEPPSKPFPDAMILRQTTPGARLRIANHARAKFFGMALGVEWDPAKLKGKRLGDIVMTHYADDRSIAGGFTLRPRATS